MNVVRKWRPSINICTYEPAILLDGARMQAVRLIATYQVLAQVMDNMISVSVISTHSYPHVNHLFNWQK